MTLAKQWQELAYGLFALACNSTTDGHSTPEKWNEAFGQLRDRYHTLSAGASVDPDPLELARELTAAIAALEVQVATRAHELAEPRIAAAEAIYEGRAAAIEQAWASDRQRKDDLIAELRRQVEISTRVRDQYVAENRELRQEQR